MAIRAGSHLARVRVVVVSIHTNDSDGLTSDNYWQFGHQDGHTRVWITLHFQVMVMIIMVRAKAMDRVRVRAIGGPY